jgi:GNAT superfamily N-acetyltransferase
VELTEIEVERAYLLRTEVLGWPDPSLRIDTGASHTALIDGADVVAAISHVTWPCPDEPGVPARYFWAVAVATGHQERGLGRRLLDGVGAQARAAGERLLWADARESAVGFYLACGGQVVGEPYPGQVTGLVNRRVLLGL